MLIGSPRGGFARGQPFEDAVLTGLFALLDDLNDQDARIEVSRIARERLRATFPAHSNNVEVVPLANGLVVAVDTGCSFGAEFFAGHLSEWRFLNAITANIPAGAKVVDVGANFGLYALHCAKAAGEGAHVVAFEPLPSAANLLERNVRDNNLTTQVTVLRTAAGSENGSASFFVAADGAFSGLHDTHRSMLKEELEVQVRTLDACAEVSAIGPVDFLKIDVEGHEGGVLAGAHDLLARSPGLLIALEYSHKNLTDASRAEILAEIGHCLDAGYTVQIASDQGKISDISNACSIPQDFAGTVLLAAPECSWHEEVLATLGNSAAEKSGTGLSDAIGFIVGRSKAALEAAEMQKQLAIRLGLDQAGGSKSIEKFVSTLKSSHDNLERRNAALMESQITEAARNKALQADLAAGRKALAEQQSVIERLQERAAAFEVQLETMRMKAEQRGDALKLAQEQRDALLAAQTRATQKLTEERDAAVERLAAVSATLDALREHAERQNEKLERRSAALEVAAEVQAKLQSANSELSEKLAKVEAAQTRATQKLTEERDAAVERLAAVSATLDALREHAERQNQKLARRAAALEAAAEVQAKLQSANSELSEELATVRSELGSVKLLHAEHIGKVRADLDSAEARAAELEESLSAARKENRALQGEAERSAQLHNQEVSRLQAAIDDARSAAIEAQRRVELLHEELAAKNEELTALTETFEGLRTEFRQLQQRDALRALKRWRRS